MKNIMKEIKEDKEKFNTFVKVLSLLVENNLDDVGYKSPIRDIVLTIVTTIEKIAKKYNLYGNEWETNPNYLFDDVIPRLQEFFEGDDNMKSKLAKIDEEKIKKHFTGETIDEWAYDTFLEKWVNINTDQSIEEYLYENLDLILDPDKFVSFTSILLLESNLNDILDNLTDVELLSAIISKKAYEGGYKIYVYNNVITITPKQWRQIVYVAVERFIRRE